MRERDWQQTILDAARYRGYRCYHTFDSRRSEPGFPDLVCAKPGMPLLAIEVKTERGRVTPAQERWLALLGSLPGVVVMIARPSDWDEIEKTLREGGMMGDEMARGIRVASDMIAEACVQLAALSLTPEQAVRVRTAVRDLEHARDTLDTLLPLPPLPYAPVNQWGRELIETEQGLREVESLAGSPARGDGTTTLTLRRA